MCYHDDYAYEQFVESDEERAQRKAREQQARLERIMRQHRCPHTNYVETGYGVRLDALGDVREYVDVYCPDCDNEDEFERAVWLARVGKVVA